MEKEFQRWTAKRKVELLLQLIRGETKLVDACREHNLKQSEVEAWMETFLLAGERGLKARNLSEPRRTAAVRRKHADRLALDIAPWRTELGLLVLCRSD